MEPSGNWCAGVNAAASDVDGVERCDHGALFVDRNAERLQPGSGHGGAVARVAVRLERDATGAPGLQSATDEREALGEAGADDEAVGGDVDAAGTGEVLGERVAKLGPPARVGVAEHVRRGGA